MYFHAPQTTGRNAPSISVYRERGVARIHRFLSAECVQQSGHDRLGSGISESLCRTDTLRTVKHVLAEMCGIREHTAKTRVPCYEAQTSAERLFVGAPCITSCPCSINLAGDITRA